MKKSLSILGILLSLSVGSHAQNAQLKPLYGTAKPVCACETLTKTVIANTQIVSATVIDKACRITAIVNHPPANDSVKVWIALPTDNWNGRFEGTGGGGFLGGRPESFPEPLSQGFAVGATNTGHDGGSGSFALNSNGQLNWQLIQDNAYLGIHDMTVVGKELVKAYYGKPAKYAYFVGGSTGGRQGLSEAQRYPKDYDGIMSFYPAVNWHKFLVTELYPQVVMHELNNYLSAKKWEALNQAIIAEFDAKDGFTDDVIENALDLKFDLKSLVGKKIGESEFTEKDAAVVQKIWEGAKTKDGQFLWYGLPWGTPYLPLAGTKDNQGAPFGISVEWVAYFLKSNPKWTGVPLTMDEFQLLYNQSVEQYGSVFGTDNPDLQAFKNNGGKLLLVHGLSDRLIVPQGTIDYYKRVVERMGGAAKTQDFTRLFLIPGLDHFYANPALKPVGWMEALMDWVEQKNAPKKMKVEHRNKEGKVTRTVFYDFFK